MTRNQVIMSVCSVFLIAISGAIICVNVLDTPSSHKSSFNPFEGDVPQWHSHPTHKRNKILRNDGLTKPGDKVVYESGLTIEVLADDYVANSQESTTSHHKLIPDALGNTLD